MFITNLLRGLKNDAGCRIRPKTRPGQRHHLRGSASRGYTRALRVEWMENRMLLTGFFVDSLADDPSAGQFDTDGLVSLREAITAANTNLPFGDAPAGDGGGIVDQIAFAESLTGQTIVLGGVELTVSDHVSISGLGADKLTISGNHASGVFWIEPGVTVDLSQVTIADGDESDGAGIYNEGTLTVASSVLTNNSAWRDGGAICNYAGSLTIIDTTLSENFAYDRGGGVWNSGTLTITNSTFTNNSTDANGGGIANREGGIVTITGSTFEGNSGSSGGAIDNYIWYADPQGTLLISESIFKENSASSGGAVFGSGVTKIANSTFSNNSARAWGGVFFAWGGAVDINDSTLSGNWAGREGGVIDNNGATLKIANSTLSGNSTDGVGGAIWNWAGNVEIANSTLTANRADADGNSSGNGGVLFDEDFARRPLLNNTIVAGNLLGAPESDSPNDFSATLDPASSHNLIGDAATAGGLMHGVNGNIVGNAGSGTIDITTVLDPNLADNGGPTLTHALVPGGPAVNAGDNGKAFDADGNPLVFDQRGEGFARIVDGTVDIGAFEVQPQVLSVEIDVKPGSDPNSINLASQGVIAVAIFTTEDFDASLVDASTVVFAGARAVHSALEDVDGDGDLDMVLHFQVQDTNLAEIYAVLLAEDIDEDGVLDSSHQTAAVSLTGRTATDECFEGLDEVDLLLSGKNLRDLLEQLATAAAI